MFPERVSQEEETALIRLVAEVEADLQYVGLPVVQGGDCTAGRHVSSSSFVVFYDPSSDESGGVFVEWSLSPEIKGAIVASPGLAIKRAIPLGSVSLEVMTNAADRILAAAGWGTDQEAVGVHESSIRVFRESDLVGE
ncbi:hypothetical protein ACFZB9_18665 [Kitasatospora sp. NPDC008050]|uniref:hypothetical protein n=1 Tax=Kitasatospora sp. NPDC008050 TaxID=3364021 RepID=UPI0036EBAC62